MLFFTKYHAFLCLFLFLLLIVPPLPVRDEQSDSVAPNDQSGASIYEETLIPLEEEFASTVTHPRLGQKDANAAPVLGISKAQQQPTIDADTLAT